VQAMARSVEMGDSAETNRIRFDSVVIQAVAELFRVELWTWQSAVTPLVASTKLGYSTR